MQSQNLIIGEKAPLFEMEAIMPNKTFGSVSLQENIDKGQWTILFFYPLDFTFVCPTEIIAFSNAVSKFEEENAQVIGASVDSLYSHLAWINLDIKKGGIGPINYPLASDFSKETAAMYGILDGEYKSQRGLFIINPEGELMYQVVTHDNVGRSTEETLRVLQALKTGQRCPANWTENAKTV